MHKTALRAAFALCLCLFFAAAPAAFADTDDIIAPSDPAHPDVNSGWQAGTCKLDPCSIATPERFFETAGAHPNKGFTQFIIKSEPPGETPVDELKTVRVDLPVGLSVNPGATERCPFDTFNSEDGAAKCASQHPDSEVGVSQVTVAILGVPFPPAAPATEVSVYNVEPIQGEAARFGLELAKNHVYLEGDVDWSGDFHEGFTIHVPAALPEALGPLVGMLGQEGLILKNRLVFDGRSGDGTFLTTPTTCFGPAYKDDWKEGEAPGGPSGTIYSTFLRADSVGMPDPNFPNGSSYFESPIPPVSKTSGPGTSPKDCDTIPYDPTIEVDPGTAEVNSPAAAKFSVDVPHLKEASGQDSSHTKRTTVTLPQGMGLNPSAANGLQTCTDEQFGKGSRNPVACPPESIVGRVKIESPPLVDQTDPQPEEALEGNVYAGKQLSRDPASGDEYRIFIDAKADRYGIDVRLVGNVRADPITGQLSTTISETPQVPFTSFDLSFNGGARAVLSSPLDLRAEQDRRRDDAVVGESSGDAGQQLHAFERTRRRQMRADDGRAAVWPGVRGRSRKREGRRLQARLDPDQPRRWPAGAERNRRRPAAGDDRQAARHPLLSRGCARLRRWPIRRRGEGELELPGREPGRHRLGRRRHRPRAVQDRRQGLPLRPLPRGSSLPGSGHPRHGRPV